MKKTKHRRFRLLDDPERIKKNQVLEEIDEFLEAVKRHDIEYDLVPDRKVRWPRPAGGALLDLNLHRMRDDATEAINRAERYGDYDLLKKHLRDGTACKEEMFVAAEILDGNVPPRKRGSQVRYNTFERYIEIDSFVRNLIDDGKTVKQAVGLAEDKWGLTKKQINKARAEVRSVQEEHDRITREDWEGSAPWERDD